MGFMSTNPPQFISEIVNVIRMNALEANTNLVLQAAQGGAEDIEHLFQLGNFCAEQGRLSDAICIFNCLHQANASDARFPYNLGFLYAVQGHYQNASQYFEKALQITPDDIETLVNFASALHELRRYDEAIRYYDHALQINPNYLEALANKGNTLTKLEKYSEALALQDQVLAIQSDYVQAWINKGAALFELKRFGEAIICYENALSINPNHDWFYGELVHARMRICSWRHFQEDKKRLEVEVGANQKIIQPFPLLALSDDPLLHRQASAIFAYYQYPANHALGPIAKYPQGNKIRIGYFSADFHNHATGYLMAELIELHDKQQFECIGISFGPWHQDQMQLRLKQSFDQLIDASALSDIQIAQLARELKIDIAIDLKGYTQHCRTGIFAYRAAPIQVSYLGYPGTMAADYMDYLIADKVLIPQSSQSAYSEKIVYLPNSYQANDRKRVISDIGFSKAQLGLPEQGFVFCSFNNNFKILPATFESWMRILKAVEGSVLWLFEDNETAATNLRQAAEKHGINPSRLIFAKGVPLTEHLARHRLADLFLDTFPCNAHTTASDALWAGLPVLTLMGQSFASRVAASLLSAMHLPELITTSLPDYEALAIELAQNRQKLAVLKQKLATNRLTTPLFDTPQFTKGLEQAYIQMYERYQADLPLSLSSLNKKPA